MNLYAYTYVCIIEIFGWMSLQINYYDDLQVQVNYCLAALCLYKCVYKIKKSGQTTINLDSKIILVINL